MKSLLKMALAAFLLAAPAYAADSMKKMDMADGEVMLGELTIANAWTRATPPGAPAGGAYVTITNNGGTDDVLIGASSPIAGVAEIHEMKVADGVMKMQHLADGLVVPAGETVVLKPGGYHVMMMMLKDAIKEGDMIELTLEFANAGTVTLKPMAAPIGAKMPAMDHSAHGGS